MAGAAADQAANDKPKPIQRQNVMNKLFTKTDRFKPSEYKELLYEIDYTTDPIVEYHHPFDLANITSILTKKTLEEKKEERKTFIDTGNRTIIDSKKVAVEDKSKGTNITSISKSTDESEDERKYEEDVYLELDTSEAIHVVEFYAPWCPHCKHYKPAYVKIAAEVKRRSTFLPVQFHAISCTLYHVICDTYRIDGYPTILGYAIGSNITKRGFELNAPKIPKMSADTIAYYLDFDLAHESPKKVKKLKFENEQEEQEFKNWTVGRTKEAIQDKKHWFNYPHNTINDRYHNAALSFFFALGNGLYVGDSRKHLSNERKAALRDFLALMDWATPLSWDVRTTMVAELRKQFDSAVIQSKQALENLLEDNIKSKVVGKTNSIWGDLYYDNHNGGGGGKHTDREDKFDEEDQWYLNRQWTSSCSKERVASGFTCGLWDLFHILTIGASQPKNQIHGYHSGYTITPAEVSKTIRNVVSLYFPCDVCRNNFVKMYDSCGHDHCTRLTSDLGILWRYEKENGENAKDLKYITQKGIAKKLASPPQRQLAIWLWEVHNAVNVRLMKEAAEREDRVVTHEETLSALFPTVELCGGCWLDKNMTMWDEEIVFQFLKHWYWPSDATSSVRRRVSPFGSVVNHGDNARYVNNGNEGGSNSGDSSGILFFFLIVLPIGTICSMIAWNTFFAPKKRRTIENSRWSGKKKRIRFC